MRINNNKFKTFSKSIEKNFQQSKQCLKDLTISIKIKYKQ